MSFGSRLATALKHLSDARRTVLFIVVIYAVYFGFYAVIAAAMPLESQQAVDLLFGLFGGLLLPLTNAVLINALHTPKGEFWVKSWHVWLNLFTAYLGIGLIFVGYLALTVIPSYGILMVLGISNPVFLGVPATAAALWVFGRFVFVDALIVIEGKRPWQARQESIGLVRANLFPILATAFLLYAVPFVLDIGSEVINARTVVQWGGASKFTAALCSLGAALAYVLPLAYFYVYYMEIRENSKAD